MMVLSGNGALGVPCSMAWFLFIDESGQQRKESPYEVLAGVAIQDRDLWALINSVHDAEFAAFGRRYTADRSEMKGKKLLKKKVFHHSQLNADVPEDVIQELAKFALDCGQQATVRHLKALALAKLGYVDSVLDICARFRCKAFASIVDRDAPGTETTGLRKDYAYLFERFYHFLDDWRFDERGIVVFDELEKSKSHILIDQTHKYFKETAIGRVRAGLIIPEPLFVHSDLTTGIQIADLLAYIISWGFRFAPMVRPRRQELDPLAEKVGQLRYRTTKRIHGNDDHVVWSFTYIDDLRTRMERGQLLE